MYSSIIRLYPQNPVFKMVHDKSVKVYLPMFNGNVQQNPLCVESCVTKKFSTSPLLSSTTFDPGANSVLLRADPRFLLFVLQNIAGYKNAVEYQLRCNDA